MTTAMKTPETTGFIDDRRTTPPRRATAEGTIEIMPPVYSDTGAKELDIGADLKVWARSDANGVAFGSNTGP
jgi:Uma2 family endonuclease